MNKQLSILFLASWYPSEVHATLGNFVQRHAQAVASIHKVVVVSAHESRQPSIETTEKGNLVEIRVYFRKQLPLFSYQKAMKRGIAQAKKKQKQFDLAHVHVAYPAGVVALNIGLPYLVTEHFSGYHPQSNFKWRFGRRSLTDRILSRAKLILPVSEHLAKAIHQFGVNTKMIQVSNVVQSNLFYYKPTDASTFTFLHISTLEERSKNIIGILKGFRKLEETNPNFILKIGGDGDIKELKEKIAQYGPSLTRIEIIGEKPIGEIADLMRSSHCYVMFSHFENQPCTILEALCCGLPVISSDVGGIPEVLNEHNGILIEAENDTSFAQGLARMITEYPNYNRPYIADEAKKIYSYEAVAERLNEIYLNVLS